MIRLRYALLFLLVLCAIAWLLNPGPEKFQKYMIDQMEDQMQASGLNTLDDANDEAEARTRLLIEELGVRTNEYIFSLYSIHVSEENVFRYVGVFGMIIPLQNKSPFGSPTSP